ncbi:leucyl/phenylalanyl-tRNA-protein transferase [Acrasis kona]|uniref:Leucyl/phenylalanyl-tRNA-protein transferase n=1 Tax=Acrasis kona TaxID=1008807 RepID=A0AAW2YY14_9EUKA
MKLLTLLAVIVCVIFCTAEELRSIKASIRNEFKYPLNFVAAKLAAQPLRIKQDFAKVIPVSNDAVQFFDGQALTSEGLGGVVHYKTTEEEGWEVNVSIYLYNYPTGSSYKVEVKEGPPFIGGVNSVTNPAGDYNVNATNAIVEYYVHQQC